MRFLMIVKSNERSEAGIMPDEKALAEMGRFNAEIIQAGVLLGGEGLHASAKGARVRISGPKTSVVDGPFAEAKELVGGFWLIQAASKAEAVEWARRAPIPMGEIEIRPLYEASDFSAAPIEPSDPPPPTPRKPGTRRYMLLLKADQVSEAGPPANPEVFAKMDALMDEMIQGGVYLSGEGLKPSSRSARVKVDGARRTVIDGPFAESKELIAGYMIVQTQTRDEALEWARRWLEVHVAGVPDQAGEIEVRLVAEVDDYAGDPAEKPDGWRDQEKKFRERTGG
jgi:hypothetical protein